MTSGLAPGPVPANMGRELVLEQLHGHKAHELIPRSGKVVVFDVDLSLRHALDALNEHGLTYAPLWDSARQDFSAMLSADDVTRLLARLGQDAAGAASGVPAGQAVLPNGRAPDDMTVRDLLRACPPPSPGPGAEGVVMASFPRLVPDESLHAAVSVMLTGRLSHIALVSGPTDSAQGATADDATAAALDAAESSTVLHVLTPLRILHCVVQSPLFQSEPVRRSRRVASTRGGAGCDTGLEGGGVLLSTEPPLADRGCYPCRRLRASLGSASATSASPRSTPPTSRPSPPSSPPRTPPRPPSAPVPRQWCPPSPLRCTGARRAPPRCAPSRASPPSGRACSSWRHTAAARCP